MYVLNCEVVIFSFDPWLEYMNRNNNNLNNMWNIELFYNDKFSCQK